MWTRLAVAWMLSTIALAQDKPPKPELKLEVKQMSFSAQLGGFASGMQVLAVPDGSSPMIASTFVVEAGWRTDPDGQGGMSALFERAWWASEVRPGVRTVDQLVIGYGCEVDSQVDVDVIRFTSLCPKQTVDRAMMVWSRLFTDPLAGLDEAAIDREAALIAGDARARTALADQQLPGLAGPLYGLVFPADHPDHRPVELQVAAIDLAGLKAWAAKTVVSARTTVSLLGGFMDENPLMGPALLVGNVDPKLMDVRLKPEMYVRWPVGDAEDADPEDLSLSWGWPADPSNPKKPLQLMPARPAITLRPTADLPNPNPTSAPFTRIVGGTDGSIVLVGWAIPGSWRQDDTLFAVSAGLITGIVTKHLEDPAMDRMMGCQVLPGLDAGVLVCAASLKVGQELAGERIGSRIVDQLSYVSDMENQLEVEGALTVAQQSLIVDQLAQLDELGGLFGSRSYWFSGGAHFASKPMLWSERLGKVGEVTTKQVIDFVTTYITRQRGRLLQIDPSPSRGIAPHVRPLDPKDRDATAARPPYWNLVATRLAPPAIPPARVPSVAVGSPLSADAITDLTLPNGLRVVVIPREDSPVVHARLVAGIGLLNDPTAHLEHTFARDQVAFHREPPLAIAGSWYAWRGDTGQVLGLRASSENLEGAMFLLRDAVDGANATTKFKAAFMTARRQQFVDDWYDPFWHADGAARLDLLGDSPLARRPTWADFTAWEGVSTDAVKAMMQTQWRPDNVTLVIVGGVEAAAAGDLARSWFGGWKVPQPTASGLGALKLERAPLPTAPKVEVFASPQGGLADVYVGCRVDVPAEVGEVAAQLLRAGESSLASLMPGVVAWPGGTSVLELRARVPEADAGRAVAGVLARLRQLGQGPVDADTLRFAAWRASFAEGAARTSDKRLVSWVTERLSDRAPLLGGAPVTGAQVLGALTTCAAGPYVAVVGDGATIDAALTAASVPHTTNDWLAAGKAAHQAADPKGFAKSEKKSAP